MTFLADDRGASTAVTHALAIGISSMLVLTMLFSVGGFLTGQEKQSTDRQLKTIGERVVTELTSAERYAVNGGETVRIRVTHPERVAGETYRIVLDQRTPGDPITLTMEYGRETGRIQYTFDVESTTTLDGGNQVVDSGDFVIVVEDTGAGHTVRLEQ